MDSGRKCGYHAEWDGKQDNWCKSCRCWYFEDPGRQNSGRCSPVSCGWLTCLRRVGSSTNPTGCWGPGKPFKADVGAGYHTMEADYHKKAAPVEHIITDHPIPSVLIAAGIGALIGMLILKSHKWRGIVSILSAFWEEQTTEPEFFRITGI